MPFRRAGSRCLRNTIAFLGAALICGCAHLPTDCERWFCRDAVYFIGKSDDVEDVPSRAAAAMGVELGRFDQVDILRRRHGRIMFRREIPYHPAFIGWAPHDAFVRRSEFAVQHRWPQPETIDFCSPGDGCYRLDVTTDGRYALTRTRSRYDDLCELRPSIQPFAGECTISGLLRVAHGYVMLAHENGYLEFFALDATGAWCWVRGRDLYGLCLPTSDALIDPSVAPTLSPTDLRH